MSEQHLQSNIQTILKDIFSSLIVGISAEELDVHANIFDLGLESIAFMEIRGAIKKKLGVNISLRSMLENNSTIHELSGYIAEKMPETTGVSWSLPKRESLEKHETPSKNGAAVRGPLGKQVSGSLTSQTAVERIVSQQLQLASQQVQMMSKQLELLRKGASGHTPTQARRPSQPSTNKEKILELGTGRPESIKQSPRTEKSEGAGLTAQQQQHLDALIARVVQRTQESKRLTQAARKGLANPRAIIGFDRSIKEMLYPLHIQRGAGARIWDVDGNEYIDLAMGFGPLLFGHSPSFVIEAIQEHVQLGLQNGPQSHLTGKVAELMCELTGQERVCFCNSGTEAVMGAIRIARATTGRTKIARFAGSYHGHSDEVLVAKIGNGDGKSRTIPAFPGIPEHKTEQVIMLDYGNPESLDIVKGHAHELAAVLVEPVQSRRPDLQPREFLHQLRQLTLETGIPLILDEVLTGFRIHPGGIQGLWGIQADISTYGKALGAGLPVGVVAGKASFMDALDGGFWSYGDESYPSTEATFFAGTYFKNPLVMSVVWAVLNQIKDRGPQLQGELTEKTTSLADHLNDYFRQKQLPIQVVHFGSLFRFSYRSQPWMNLLYYHLLSRGIYVSEGRNLFLSTAHTDEDIEQIIGAVKASIEDMQAGGFLPRYPSTESNQSDEGKKEVQLPLTAFQKELWITAQMAEGASVAYNESIGIHLRGRLNLEVMGKAVRELVNRHEALRTTFSPMGDYQRIAPKMGILDIPLVDFSSLDNDKRDAEVSQLLVLEAGKPFDFEVGPLFRPLVVKLSEEHHILLLTFHHLVVDGWSLKILLRELGVIYSARCQGVSGELPQPMQYSEYVRLQETRQQSPEMAKAEAYWLQQFASSIPVLDLPTDRRRPSVNRYRGDRQTLKLGEDMCDRLKILSGECKCTLFTTLLAGFGVLLHRLSGQNDIVVGIPTAGQLSAGCEDLVGHCANLLPLRVQVDWDPTFKDYASAVKKVLLNGYDHQIYPLLDLIQKLQLPRDRSRTPLIGTLFNLDKINSTPEFGGLEVELTPNHSRGAKFDLIFDITQTNSDLIVMCDYNSDLFDAETIRRWLGHFQTLLSGAAANHSTPISQLPLLTEAERRQILVEWNDTDADYTHDLCIHQLFEQQVDRTPDAVAVVFGSEKLTYQQLNERANQLAHYLQSVGVGPEVLVGLCVERSVEMIVGLLGILKAGGAYVPIDPNYPPDRINYIQVDAQLSVLLTQTPQTTALSTHPARVISLALDGNSIAQQPRSNPESTVQSTNLAYVIYTSGSTGKPKGVTIQHRAVVNLSVGLQQAIYATQGQRHRRVSLNASLVFDASVQQLTRLLHGDTLDILPPTLRWNGEALLSYLQQQQIDVFDCTPSHLKLINVEKCLKQEETLPEIVLVGGEAIHDLTWQVLAQAKQTKFYNVYGPTECTVDTTVAACQMNGVKPVIGRPLANTQIYILDSNLQPVPIGVPGELHIGGVGVARGYLNRPELTLAKFIPNPFSNEPGARLYKTGDLARYRADGNIEFVGRIDNQVKIRGFRIELGEIEATLASHKQVRSTVVVAREDQPGDKRLVAYIVSEPTAPEVGELREFLKGKLPNYMVPTAFVMLETLPLTPNGKVDRRALPAPEGNLLLREGLFILPQTPIEQTLAEIWESLLGVGQVGIYDNFFTIGGDSILSIQVVSRARSAGIYITPRQIFEYQTIAELAANASTAPSAQAQQGIVKGEVPLTPIQHWFLEQQWSEPHYFNQSVLLEVPADINPQLLQWAIEHLLEHHDALRLRFVQHTDNWQQFHAGPGSPAPFERVDLSVVPLPEQFAEMEKIAAARQASLNLTTGPLMRVVLFDLGHQQAARLLLIIHHLAVDGVSWRILLEDLFNTYQQLKRDEPIELPPKTTAFQDWALTLSNYSQSQALRSQLEYWLNQPWSQVVRMPVDFPEGSGENTVATSAVISVSLSETETQALLQQVQTAYNTQINDVLLTALVQSMAAWQGTSTVLVDLEGHGREDLFAGIDLSRTVGWFTSIFPVMLSLEGTFGSGEALKAIKEQLRAIPQGGLGYGVLRYLHGDRQVRSQLENLPKSEVVFNYLGQFAPLKSLTEHWQLASNQETGSDISQMGQNQHLLSINAIVMAGKLQVNWSYSRKQHHAATIERLALGYLASLQALIDHCLSPEAGGYTPSDFPEANLSQGELDQLARLLG